MISEGHCVSISLQIAQIEIENLSNGITPFLQKLPYITKKAIQKMNINRKTAMEAFFSHLQVACRMLKVTSFFNVL